LFISVRLRNLIRGGLGPIWAVSAIEEEEEEEGLFSTYDENQNRYTRYLVEHTRFFSVRYDVPPKVSYIEGIYTYIYLYTVCVYIISRQI
jgi:hypothetical protein